MIFGATKHSLKKAIMQTQMFGNKIQKKKKKE